MSLHDAKKQLTENLDILTPIATQSKENIFFYNLSGALLNIVHAIEEMDEKMDDLKSKQSTISSRLTYLIEETEKK